MEYKLDELESWKITAEELSKELQEAHEILDKNNIPKYDGSGSSLTLKERINWFLSPTKKKRRKVSEILTMVVRVEGTGSSKESAEKQVKYNICELMSIIRRMKNVWDIVQIDCDFFCLNNKEEK